MHPAIQKNSTLDIGAARFKHPLKRKRDRRPQHRKPHGFSLRFPRESGKQIMNDSAL